MIYPEDTDNEFMPDEADEPQIFDLDTDCLGNCFTDADPGL